MRRVLVTSTALTLLLTACGGGDDGGGKAAPSGGATSGGATSAAAPVALTGTVNDHGTKDVSAETKTEMELDDFYFGPTYVRVKPGTTLTLELENEGDAPHTFTVDGLADVTVQPGQKGEAKIALPASGAVRFYCKFHAAQGMQGAFYSQPGDTVAPAGAPSGSGSGDGGAYNQ
ncbi:MAG TPA: cupredoxin domain-containing protein [Mycobacteriales bacterium]|jgi:plastocyanin